VTLTERVRRQVARYVWPDNPASVSLAASAVSLATLAESGDVRARECLRLALAHLQTCERVQGRLDELRARVVAKQLASFDPDTATG
jgi:hypothetical protein